METVELTDSTPTGVPIEVQQQTPELALGGPLAPEQLQAMAEFTAEHNLPRIYDSTEKARQEELTSRPHAEYDAELGEAFLEAINGKTTFIGFNLYNAEERKLMAADEASFQATIQAGFIKGHNTVADAPSMFRLFAGEEKFTKALEVTLEKNPNGILRAAKEIRPTLEDAAGRQLITSAYDSVNAISDRPSFIRTEQVNEGVIECVGLDRVRADVQRHIADKTLLGQYVNSGEVRDLMRLGVLNQEEGDEVVLARFKSGDMALYYATSYAREEGEGFTTRLDDTVLEVAANKDTRPDVIEELVSASLNQYGSLSGENREAFRRQVLEGCRQSHGDAILLGHVRDARDVLGAEEINAVIQTAIGELRDGAVRDKTQLLAGLKQDFEYLDENQRPVVADAILQNDPADFLSTFAGKYSPDTADAFEQSVHQKIVEMLPGLTADTIFTHLENVHKELAGSPETFETYVLSRLPEIQSVNAFNKLYSGNILTEEQRLDAARFQLANNAENVWQVGALFGALKGEFGIDAAKELLAEQMSTNPEVTLDILRSHTGVFSEQELMGMTDQIMAAGLSGQLAWGLDRLSQKVPKERVLDIINRQLSESPLSVPDSLAAVTDIFDGETLQGLADRLLVANPAVVLSKWKSLPEGLFADKQQVLDFMIEDGRSQLLPKYFKRIVKRLGSDDESTAFQIMAREATVVYSKLNIVGNAQAGNDMFGRILADMPNSSERSEMDALSYAAFLVRDEVEPGRITGLAAAKQALMSSLNTRFGTELSVMPEAVQAFEAKVGSLVPLTTYMRGMQRVSPDIPRHLVEAVDALEKDNFRTWKYGELSALVGEEVLPKLSTQQYEVWQENTQATNTEISVGGAENVARHIQRVMLQNAAMIKGLEKLGSVEDPALLIMEARDEIKQMGQGIAQVHQARGKGEIDHDEASRILSDFEAKKSELQYAMNVLRLTHITAAEVAAGKIFNDSGKATQTTLDGVLNEVVERNGQNGLDALGQIQTVLDNFREEADVDIGEITIGDTDNFQTTIELGANPVGSCQHYEVGMLREGLVGYFDPGVKVITVANQRGRYVARAAMRLVHDSEGAAALVMEPTYMSQASDDIVFAVTQHAKKKADAMGIPLYGMDAGDSHFVKPESSELFIRGQRAPHLYSDVFGGLRKKGQTATGNTRKLARLN